MARLRASIGEKMSTETYKLCRHCGHPRLGELSCRWCGAKFKRRFKVNFSAVLAVLVVASVAAATLVLAPKQEVSAAAWPVINASQRPTVAETIRSLKPGTGGVDTVLNADALMLLGQPDRATPKEWEGAQDGTWYYQCKDGWVRLEIRQGRVQTAARQEGAPAGTPTRPDSPAADSKKIAGRM
jgi:uncharacterized protein (DUF983 family)